MNIKYLVEKYEYESKVLLQVIQNINSKEDDIQVALVARRFVNQFMNELKALDSDELPMIEDLELFELQIEQTMDFIDVSKENKEAWKMGFKSGFKIALTPNPFI